MQAGNCKIQSIVSAAERAAALRVGRCEICSVTEGELRASGQSLEVCGIEHFWDLASSETTFLAVPMCPDCHRAHHLDAQLTNDPGPGAARQSWEELV